MSSKKTITINGRHYDALSGLAVNTPGTPAEPTPTSTVAQRRDTVPHSTSIHNRTQRSHTLHRKALKRPHQDITTQKTTHDIITRKNTELRAHKPTLQRSSTITKFAAHPVGPAERHITNRQPVPHPHVVKAHTLSQAKHDKPLADVAPKSRQTSQEIKQSAIQQAIANTSANHTRAPKKRLLARHPRKLSIVSTAVALVVFGGYLTYLNMPSLSVRVAAAQAGINAAYPNYHPDGYSLNGTVGYSQGKVTMRFASNGGPTAFTVNQAKSSWDSEAVLDNYVTPRAGAGYIPYTERGLTIYTYGNNAAWVNGGILYTIEGDAPLSSEQIRRIATSLI